MDRVTLSLSAGAHVPSRRHCSRRLLPGPASAAAIVQALAACESEAQLGDAMLALALDYAHGSAAYLLWCEGKQWRLAGHAGTRVLAKLPAALPDAVAHALAQLVPDAGPAVAGLAGKVGVALALTAHGAGPAAALCVLGQETPSAACLGVLTLLAACATLQLARLRDAARFQLQNQALQDELHARMALAGHLADERGLLRTLIDNMPDHIYVKDRNGRFIVANHAAARSAGAATPQDLVGKSDLELYPLECGQRFFSDEQKILRSGQPIIDQTEENVNQAGVRRWFSTTKFPFYDADGSPLGIVGISRDVTQRVETEDAIRLRNRVIELSVDGTVIAGCNEPGMPIRYVNSAFERITGFTLEDAQLRGIDVLLDDAADSAGAQGLRDAMREQHEGHAVLRSVRKDGTAFWNEVRLAIVRDRAGAATHFVYTMSDISAARHAEERLELLASHDALTGLPNRRMLMDRLTQAIAMSERGSMLLAVAFIDLDRLKFINDTCGHEAGDQMLHTVADRMAACVRKSDTLARLGGDEFVMVSLHNRPAALQDERGHVVELLAKVQQALGMPIMLGGAPYSVTCSIGVSLYPQDGHDAESLLKHADAAMYAAKKGGGNRIEFCLPAAS